MAEKNEYSYKLNEVYHAATVHTKRLMKTYAEEYAYHASEEEGESEKKKVLKFFAETILSGVAKGLLDYFDKNEIYDMLDTTELYSKAIYRLPLTEKNLDTNNIFKKILNESRKKVVSQSKNL